MKYFNYIAAVITGALLLSSCSSKEKPASGEVAIASTPAGRQVVPVKVSQLAKTKISRTIDYTATILPFEEVNMVPSTPGRVDRIYVEVGDRVSKGQKLFLMDRTQLYQLQIQLNNQAKDLARLDTLLKSGSARQQQYDQLKAQYDVTKTNVDFMEENTLIKAPFSGIVTGKYFEDGEMFSGSPTTATGRSAVVTIQQVNPLKANVNISEQYYPVIKKGMNVTVTADVYGNETFTGKVYRISPTISSATRSFTVEIELQNRNDMLKPGMFARVFVDLGEIESFVVPSNTVMMQEGTNDRYVFISKDNAAERINVALGKRFDDKVEIISASLREGDMIVSEGQAKLINGDKLDIVK